MKLIFLSICVLTRYIENVNGLFHCGREMKSFKCSHGTCVRDTGNCTCSPEWVGEDCSVAATEVCADDAENPCLNGQICYGNGKCLCDHRYYGPTCSLHTVDTVCKGSHFTLEVALPQDFEGKIYLKNDSKCVFTEVEALDSRAGFKRFQYNMSLKEEDMGACNNAISKTEEVNDIIYSTEALVIFIDPEIHIVIDSDLSLQFRCVHRASDVEMGSLLGAVNLDEKKNLQNQQKEKVYAAVQFRFLDEKNVAVKQLSVGEKFKLMFYLDDDSVYTSLLLISCSANNTDPGKPKIFKFLQNSCPTKAGKNVIYEDYGQAHVKFTSPARTSHTAAELMLKAFKFINSDRVAFSCLTRICKRDNEARCGIPDCQSEGKAVLAAAKPAAEAPGAVDPAAAAPTEDANAQAANVAAASKEAAPGGAAGNTEDTASGIPADQTQRKKRSTLETEERTISGVIKIIEPIQITSKQAKPREKENECFRSRDIIIVIIVMSAFVLALLIACVVLAVTVSKTRTRVNNMMTENSNTPSFFIPRAKVMA